MDGVMSQEEINALLNGSADSGEQAMKENALIVYTSADSVFQVAANEELVPVHELYRYCEIAREMLKGE